jgi:hypothetical protein
MIVSLLLLIALAASGMSLTYLVARDRPFMWRLAAGNIIASAIFGLASFVVACFAGFSAVTVGISLSLSLAPIALLKKKDISSRLKIDWERAKGKLQGGNAAKFLRFIYYAFFFIVFWYFFDRVAFELKDGIYTGGSQNYGDLPFHLGAIFSFTEINNFPPVNPSWAGAKFSYPFIADLLTACYIKLGAGLIAAMFVQNVSWAFSLLVLLESFVVKLTGSKLAGRIAPALLFFSGGLGFVWAFKDMAEHAKGISDFLFNLPKDYTISDNFRWGNSMVVLFMTQRSLLLGMPLTVLVLGYLWRVFACDETEVKEGKSEKVKEGKSEKASLDSNGFFTFAHFPFSPFLVGLLAGMLPLIHLHSLVTLFVVTAFLFAFQPRKWKTWLTFGVGVSVVAIPVLAWAMTGSASETSKFFEWHFGWDKKPDDNLTWFWLKNTGILIPMIVAGAWLYFTQTQKGEDVEGEDAAKIQIGPLLLFYIPFVALFVIGNVAKLAPWQWDNIKVLIYWFLLSIPFVALVIAWLWEKNILLRGLAIVGLIVLTLAGALDVFRTATGVVKMRVFELDGMKLADQIKAKTPQKALFLNAPTFNSPVVLSGRQSLMRYTGHLSSHGIDIGVREQELRQIYQGGGVSDVLLKKYDIDYVLMTHEERNTLKANEEFFKKYPVAAEAGEYRVYKVK